MTCQQPESVVVSASEAARMFSGAALRTARENAQMKREDLALRVGRSSRTVEDWEGGRYRPRANMVFEIARVLGVTPADLTGSEGIPTGDVSE